MAIRGRPRPGEMAGDEPEEMVLEEVGAEADPEEEDLLLIVALSRWVERQSGVIRRLKARVAELEGRPR